VDKNEASSLEPIDSAPKRSRSEGRRNELARIAYQLIAEHGLENFRTRRVAEAAGIDAGTLHYHFPSKESLVQAVLDRLIADFRVSRVVSNSDNPSPIEKLRAELRDVALRVQQSPEQFRILVDLRIRATRDRAIASMMTKLDEALQRRLVEILKSGLESGIFRRNIDPELAALTLRTEMIGLGVLTLLGRDGAEDIASTLADQWEYWLTCE
jgi:AcrR family transcriptional regulator